MKAVERRRALADASMVVRRCLPYSTYRILSTSWARPEVYEPARYNTYSASPMSVTQLLYFANF